MRIGSGIDPRRLRRASALVAGAAALAGCATAPLPDVDVVPLARPCETGAVGVIVAATPAGSAFETPYADKAQAFGAGAAKSGLEYLLLSFPLLAVAGPALVFYGPAVLAVAAAPAVAGALVTGAATAAAMPPEETAASLRRMAAMLAEDTELPRTMADDVAAGTRRFANCRADVLDAPQPEPTGAVPGYRALHGRGYVTVIDVRVTRIGYAWTGGGEPAVALFLAADARRVDAATGKATRLRGLLYQSAGHRPEAWLRDDGALVKLERAKARRTLAERIVDDLLLETEATFGPGSAVPRTCGLDPIRPAVAWSWTGNLRTLESQPAGTPVESVLPLLAWQPRPAHADARVPAPWARASDVRYDLRIWNEIDGAPGEIVYERTGLASAGHRVETPLAPKSRYYWSVRMRYAVDGHPRATRWSAANTPRLELVPPLTALVHYSRRDGDAVVPRACGAEDLDSCGCLDFIPPRSAYRFTTP